MFAGTPMQAPLPPMNGKRQKRPAAPGQPNALRRWIRAHSWTAFLLATVLLTVSVHFYIALFVPPSTEKDWKEVQITEGMSLKAVAAKLQQEGIIRYRGYFEIIGRIQGISRKVRTGYYGLGAHMSLWEVLDAVRTGRIIEYQVVIPEGYNLFQIGYTLAQSPVLDDPNRFIDLATDRKFAQSLGVDGGSLEGYLFPDTYYLPKGIKVEDIAKRMVQRYRAVFTPDYAKRAEDIGMSEHQVITLASIVEKEAKVDDERKLIAAVYHNRLKKGIKLQADPTAVYGKKAWITKVTKDDLKRRTPYNTYLHKGLPPGPIANPGQGAILATLYPEKVDYLFFVAQGDGSHYFSNDFGEHEKAIGRYKANRRKARQQTKQQMQQQAQEKGSR